MAQTVLYGALETELAGAAADRDQLWIPLDDLERATGWTAKPEGLCQGDSCVPVPAAHKADWLDEEARRLDFAAFATYLGHAVVRDEDRGVWSFGPPVDRRSPIAGGGDPDGSAGGAGELPRGIDRGAASAPGPVAAPDFRLPDLDGKLHSLSDHRGKKILLYCFASW